MTTEPQPTTPAASPSRFGCLFEIIETVVLTVLIFFGIQTFVAQPYKVQQTSMERTLLQDQYVLVDKLSPRWDTYGRGDIVVFHPWEGCTGSSDVPYIKRVVAVAGDTIELRDGRVIVNGVALDEPYVYQDGGEPQRTDPTPGGQATWLVGEGQVFVMGDHRQASADSRSCGPIDVDQVVGRAFLRYWPFDALTLLERPAYPELAGAGA